jgi:hypothetical protein
MQRSIVLYEIAVGRHVRLCNGWYEVLRHGNMGTEVRPLDKVTRTVTSSRTGESKTFEVPQKSVIISAASPVYEVKAITHHK